MRANSLGAFLIITLLVGTTTTMAQRPPANEEGLAAREIHLTQLPQIIPRADIRSVLGIESRPLGGIRVPAKPTGTDHHREGAIVGVIALGVGGAILAHAFCDYDGTSQPNCFGRTIAGGLIGAAAGAGLGALIGGLIPKE